MLAEKLSGAGAAVKTYVDDVFSTYLYTGNGSTQTINNGIDLAGKGGMVWTKSRTESGRSSIIFDTSRGINAVISSNLTGNYTTSSGDAIASFGASGYTLGADTGSWGVNNAANGSLVSWTFRKAPKFFDVVTWTGTGSSNPVSHSLGSTPALVFIKATTSATDWAVWYGRSDANQVITNLKLNTTDSGITGTWDNLFAGVSTFNPNYMGPGGGGTITNAVGVTYVAYLFAHDTSADGLIQCGSFTTANNLSVELGWEPQFLLVKCASHAGNWEIVDTQRGFTYGADYADPVGKILKANLSDAEASSALQSWISISANGFRIAGAGGDGKTYIYMAIRRPTKPPTSGSDVFGLSTSPNGVQPVFGTASINASQYVDLAIAATRNGSVKNFQFADLLRGFQNTTYLGSATATSPTLSTSSTSAESASGNMLYRRTDLAGYAASIWTVYTGEPTLTYAFKRAPGFFDVVCYTGSNSTLVVPHSLTVLPQLTIIKCRDGAFSWIVFAPPTNTMDGIHANDWYGYLNTTNAGGIFGPITYSPTSLTILGAYSPFNQATNSYVAYLFATLPGISKVGSYTGNGSSQTINCGFTTGARFVLIKRTDSAGDWYVWDTARGLTASTDPHLSLNSTAAEVTTDDSVDPDTSGFIVNQDASTNINVNAGTYLYLAIA